MRQHVTGFEGPTSNGADADADADADAEVILQHVLTFSPLLAAPPGQSVQAASASAAVGLQAQGLTCTSSPTNSSSMR